MKSDLLKYIRKINSKPSAQRRLLEQFVSNGASTIPEMSKGIGVSLPTATTALNDLIKAGLVREVGREITLLVAFLWSTTWFQRQAILLV